MRMRPFVFVLLVLLATSGVAWAEFYQYEMMLNKDENLCPGIMAQLNQDLAKFKEIRYGTHKAFPVVKWKRMNDLSQKFNPDDERSKMQWAKFDINNDHAVDLVVRHSSDNSYGPDDLYYIFDGGYDGLKRIRSSQQFLDAFRKHGIGSIYPTAHYLLNDLPPLTPIVEKEQIDAHYAITPFIVKRVTYLHIDQAVSRDDHSLYHVVTKFTRATVSPGKGEHSETIDFGSNLNELEDVCYFRLYVDNQRTMERSADRMTLTP